MEANKKNEEKINMKNNNEKVDKLQNKIDNDEKKINKEILELNDTITKLNKDVEHWKNEYYKAYADIDNLRKSIEKDHFEFVKYRAEGFISKILSVLDGFSLALNGDVKSEEVKNYLVGFKYIYNNLLKVLKDEGVEEIIPKTGDTFDEKKMEVVETVYQENMEPNKILKVNLNGYMLKDHLIRPAIVLVSTNIKKSNPKENVDNQKLKK